jgi:hypothetical protein
MVSFLSKIDNIQYDQNSYNHILNVLLKCASRGNQIETINYLTENGATSWCMGLFGAASGGHIDLMKFYISKYKVESWESVLACAAIKGQIDVIKIFSCYIKNWDDIMYGAAKGGYQYIIKFCISKGASDWNWGMEGAIQGGFRDIIKFFNLKGAPYPNVNLNCKTRRNKTMKYELLDELIDNSVGYVGFIF